MGETGVEISHKYPTNLFIGETKPKREKKRTRETAQILQKVSKKDEAKHKMFHQAESRWGPFQKRERPPNCLTKLVKITQATLINLVHFYFFLMQWWIDLTLIYITWLPFSDLINLVPHPPTHPPLLNSCVPQHSQKDGFLCIIFGVQQSIFQTSIQHRGPRSTIIFFQNNHFFSHFLARRSEVQTFLFDC